MYIKGGDGGNGIVTHYRDNRVVSGHPDGGDGGRGGSVIMTATKYFKDF